MMRSTILLYILLCVCMQATAQSLPSLIPFFDGQQWGYSDNNGTIRIRPDWDKTFFFSGGKAIVARKSSGSHTGYEYSMIDTAGHYIIPPSFHWTGQYSGWTGPLNVRDDQGRWGMIDTDAHLMIPFEWDAPGAEPTFTGAEPCKVVRQNGLAGILDKNNQLVIPCRYKYILPINGPADRTFFLVALPGNADAVNANGVLDLHNNVIVPIQYQDIEYGTCGTVRGYRLSTVRTDRRNPTSKIYDWQWMDLDDGYKTRAVPDEMIHGCLRSEAYGYTVIRERGGSAVYDAAGNKVIPCCDLYNISQDTITLISRQQRGKDSLVVTYTYLDTRSRRQLGPSRVLVQYREPMDAWKMPEGMCSNGVRAWNESINRWRNLPQVYVNEQWTKIFFRDSLRCSVSDYAPDFPFKKPEQISRHRVYWPWYRLAPEDSVYILINAQSASGNVNYWSIIDQAGNYIVRPCSWFITGYDPDADLVSVRNNQGQSALLNSRCDTLTRLSGREYKGGFRDNGRLYTFVVTAEQAVSRSSGMTYSPDQYYYIRTIKLADTAGELIPALQDYQLTGLDVLHGGMQVLQVQDSVTGKKAFMRPDGAQVCTALNFRYKSLTLVAGGRFALVNEQSAGPAQLVDTCGEELMPGLKVLAIAPVADPFRPHVFRPGTSYSAPGPGNIWTLQYKAGPDNKTAECYLDHRGRIYMHKPDL